MTQPVGRCCGLVFAPQPGNVYSLGGIHLEVRWIRMFFFFKGMKMVEALENMDINDISMISMQ